MKFNLEKLDYGKMKKLSATVGFNENVLCRTAITAAVVAKRLRVCSREAIETTKERRRGCP